MHRFLASTQIKHNPSLNRLWLLIFDKWDEVPLVFHYIHINQIRNGYWEKIYRLNRSKTEKLKMKPNKRKQEFWFHVPYWRQNHKIAVWFESLSVTTTTENLCSIGIFAHCKSAIFISLSLSHTIQLNLNFKSSFLFSHRKYFNLKKQKKNKMLVYVLRFSNIFNSRFCLRSRMMWRLAMKLIFGIESSANGSE